MRKMLLLLIGICSVPLAAGVPSRAGAETLTDARFRELLGELQPPADEPWRTIPWSISLLEAQRNAAKENKPIFIWAMDGHPLGCT